MRVHPKHQIEFEERNVFIFCESSRQVIWKKDGRPIKNDRISVYKDTNIKIDWTKSSDGGIYECHGYTEMGKQFIGYSELLVAS